MTETRPNPRTTIALALAFYVATMLYVLGGFAGFALPGASAQYGYPGDKKVTICHRPPGNPSNAHTISVSENAVAAHMKHGDTIGPC